MAVGIIILAALIIAGAAYFIYWFIKRSYARYAEKWSVLTPIVSGTAKGAKMTGTYQGMPVTARINSVSDSDNSNTRYFFEVTLDGAAGARDWTIQYGGEKFLGFGEKRWHVSTKDDALKSRFEQRDEFRSVEQFGYPTITYKARRGQIQYSEHVPGMFDIPDPQRFTAQLELLARLMRTSQQLNAA